MILFYNIVYVYVCKTSDEKFGGCWRSFSWLGRTVHVIDIVDTRPVDALSASALDWLFFFSSFQFPLGLHHHAHLVCLTPSGLCICG